jgi:hypothetical protein
LAKSTCFWFCIENSTEESWFGCCDWHRWGHICGVNGGEKGHNLRWALKDFALDYAVDIDVGWKNTSSSWTSSNMATWGACIGCVGDVLVW